MPDLVMFKHFPYISRENIAENIYKNAISLPSGTDITETELNVVRDTIKKYVHQ
jgi:dTDP-4-amino-4,6-dideoxygalactose transaminase